MDALLNRLREEIEESTEGLADVDWSRAPQGRWNSAQILEHLGRSYGTTAKMLELCMETGNAPQIRAAKIRELLVKLLIVNLGVFPSGAKSPVQVLPQGDSGPEALRRALSNLERMDIAIAKAELCWGNDKPIAMHPILGPLNPAQWRKFHYLHGHHHVRQMRERVGRKAAG